MPVFGCLSEGHSENIDTPWKQVDIGDVVFESCTGSDWGWSLFPDCSLSRAIGSSTFARCCSLQIRSLLGFGRATVQCDATKRFGNEEISGMVSVTPSRPWIQFGGERSEEASKTGASRRRSGRLPDWTSQSGVLPSQSRTAVEMTGKHFPQQVEDDLGSVVKINPPSYTSYTGPPTRISSKSRFFSVGPRFSERNSSFISAVMADSTEVCGVSAHNSTFAISTCSPRRSVGTKHGLRNVSQVLVQASSMDGANLIA
mmetsp:Transcript_133991/g.387805  ORF Transcript_133991/g.387805 Transcript_133991/m.387805 type:complete len:257 (+) Transcript_133991:195-965(+)